MSRTTLARSLTAGVGLAIALGAATSAHAQAQVFTCPEGSGLVTLDAVDFATMPPAEIWSRPRSGSRSAVPALRSSPHTDWNLSGSKKIGNHPSAYFAVFFTDWPIRLAQKIGMFSRTGWLISLSGLPRPVPWPSGSGIFVVGPS